MIEESVPLSDASGNSMNRGNPMSQKNLPIGVFDSGLGGLTAVREIRTILPGENLVYFGDTGRLPYGTRSPEKVRQYALDDMNFLLTNHVKAVCIACGTVSSTALDLLKSTFDVPIIGVVSPAASQAVSLTHSGKIGVLATPSTIRSGSFDRAIHAVEPAVSVKGIGCPMFVPLVENGYISPDDPITRRIAEEYIGALADFAPDVLILGCTHYPIIRGILEDVAHAVIGENVRTVDSGSAAAMALKSYLTQNDLLSDAEGEGSEAFFVSDDPEGFERIASLFLGRAIGKADRIDIGDFRFEKS